ncbi:MAG: HEAT repeat domain-containing protein [Gammaproteobacteria bacterium]|nr:HEAT repeat domain-containing protein [Gammaproteobacteria bacterium]
MVLEMPTKNWVCFFLARTLGNMNDRDAADMLLAVLQDSRPEAASGRPDPLGPGVLFLHNDLTPCWRAAVVWSLGRLGDRRAVAQLLDIVDNLDNATGIPATPRRSLLTRLADTAALPQLQRLVDGYPEISVRLALREACAACEREGVVLGKVESEREQPLASNQLRQNRDLPCDPSLRGVECGSRQLTNPSSWCLDVAELRE